MLNDRHLSDQYWNHVHTQATQLSRRKWLMCMHMPIKSFLLALKRLLLSLHSTSHATSKANFQSNLELLGGAELAWKNHATFAVSLMKQWSNSPTFSPSKMIFIQSFLGKNHFLSIPKEAEILKAVSSFFQSPFLLLFSLFFGSKAGLPPVFSRKIDVDLK